MISSDLANIDALVLHKVGNKASDEGVRYSKTALHVDENVSQLLLKYFLSPFKDEEYYQFHHDSGLELHEMFQYASNIFEDPGTLYDQSLHIAKHLYNSSNHPKIKSGELYIAYLQDCIVDGETVDAIGVFKSESKETYLKINAMGEGFEIHSEDGINIKKLDKGCLIFNLEAEDGYIVAQVDNLSKQAEAHFWSEDFLKVKQRTNDFYHTANTLELCKEFVSDKLSKDFDVSMLDKSDLLNKSAQFFKEKDTFNSDEFAEEVFQQPEVVESFNNFKTAYQEENNLAMEEEFDISNSAVKKQQRYFKSVIKLDKNFHVYVHGKRERIERGYDEARGLNYYTLYFEEEN
jgi:hypothetical protein